MKAARVDAYVMVKADLVRGTAAYARDTSEELTEGSRALRAQGERLRRHFDELEAVFLSLQKEGDELLRLLEQGPD